MKRRILFAAGLFLGGILFHLIFSYLWRLPAPSPQWLLLAVVAVGTMGKTDAAQTLGFLWGLFLDAQSGSLFGGQAWILAAAGFGVGHFSKQVDADKLSAQSILALGATLFHLLALAQIELLFRRVGQPHAPPAGAAMVQLLMNVAAAPLVFRAMGFGAGFLPAAGGAHVFRR